MYVHWVAFKAVAQELVSLLGFRINVLQPVTMHS